MIFMVPGRFAVLFSPHLPTTVNFEFWRNLSLILSRDISSLPPLEGSRGGGPSCFFSTKYSQTGERQVGTAGAVAYASLPPDPYEYSCMDEYHRACEDFDPLASKEEWDKLLGRDEI